MFYDEALILDVKFKGQIHHWNQNVSGQCRTAPGKNFRITKFQFFFNEFWYLIIFKLTNHFGTNRKIPEILGRATKISELLLTKISSTSGRGFNQLNLAPVTWGAGPTASSVSFSVWSLLLSQPTCKKATFIFALFLFESRHTQLWDLGSKHKVHLIWYLILIFWIRNKAWDKHHLTENLENWTE